MQKAWLPFAIIMVAVLAWGSFHAVGAYRLNHNVWRPIVVLAATELFLGWWMLLLWSRQRRLRRQAEERLAEGAERGR